MSSQLLKKSSHRKETDIDFEEKKLNLGLGEEELDKENDYYTRPASPVLHGDVPPPYVISSPIKNQLEGEIYVLVFFFFFKIQDSKSLIPNHTTNIHLHLLKGDGLRHVTLLLTVILHLATRILMKAGVLTHQNQSIGKGNTITQKDTNVHTTMAQSRWNEICIRLPANPNPNFLLVMINDGPTKGTTA